ncbi:transcriptional repressor c-terminal [Lucifera butyrica]|uniref:Transcriptional repressor c-terminal n=1 Tax=Lucifera butyrica TaxID=1351585 RepID=A0A498R9Q2_9FIRM|nr:FeoA family protein [Lucifera butyrica]VBB07670.1 transcriptional repressor c-terminal [Lucifera butyrica]
MRKTLDQLAPGETGIITGVAGNGTIKRRMIDMGLVAGTKFRIQRYAPLGDPIEIKIKNFNLALRKAEAALVEVQIG